MIPSCFDASSQFFNATDTFSAGYHYCNQPQYFPNPGISFNLLSLWLCLIKIKFLITDLKQKKGKNIQQRLRLADEGKEAYRVKSIIVIYIHLLHFSVNFERYCECTQHIVLPSCTSGHTTAFCSDAKNETNLQFCLNLSVAWQWIFNLIRLHSYR